MEDITSSNHSAMNNSTSNSTQAPIAPVISISVMTPQEAAVILAISLIIDIIGIIGNVVVVFVIIRTKSLRERLPNQFIINQSIIDFFSCISLILSALPKKVYLGNTMVDELYCRLYLSNAFSWGLVFSSTYSLIALTMERYLSIVHPVWHKQHCTKGRAWVIMFLTWVFGLVEGIAHAVPTSYVKDGICYAFYGWPSEWARMLAGLITVTLHYIMPMAVLVFCYGKMALFISGRIKKDNNNTKQNEKAETNSGELWTKAKRNVIHALTLVSVLFAVCWSMNQIYYLMMCLGYPPDFSSIFYNITVLAIYMNSCVNPIVYFAKYEQFQRAARAVFCGFDNTVKGELSSLKT